MQNNTRDNEQNAQDSTSKQDTQERPEKGGREYEEGSTVINYSSSKETDMDRLRRNVASVTDDLLKESDTIRNALVSVNDRAQNGEVSRINWGVCEIQSEKAMHHARKMADRLTVLLAVLQVCSLERGDTYHD